MEGILSSTGGEPAITGGGVVAASENCAAGDAAGVAVGVAVGVAEEATDDCVSDPGGCAGAVLAQPVRTKRATPTEANRPLWGPLVELII